MFRRLCTGTRLNQVMGRFSTSANVALRNHEKTTLLVDLDGTLVNTLPCTEIAFEKLCERNNLKIEYDSSALQHLNRFGYGPMIKHMLKCEYVLTTAQEEKYVQEFLDIILNETYVNAQIYPHVSDGLERLANQGNINLVLCTNVPQKIAEKMLKHFDLHRYFTMVVGGDVVPLNKPNPDHARYAIDKAGGDRRHTIVVGDDENDSSVATKAELPIFMVPYGYAVRPVALLYPNLILNDIGELSEAVKLYNSHLGSL